MSFASLRNLFASTSARLSAVYALLLVLAFAIMGVAIVHTTDRMTIYELRGPLMMEAAFVRDVIATEGLQHAVAEINLRTAHSTLLMHRLDNAEGRLLAGDPRLPRQPTGWSYATLPSGGGPIMLLSEDVGQGAQLTVGIELTWPHSVRDATLRALALIGAIVLPLALAIGIISTNFSLRRMRALWQALRRAGEGDFQARAPVHAARAPDDIDALALRFNEMMDHTDRLVGNIRRVSSSVAHDLRTPLTHLSQRLDRASHAETLEAARNEIVDAQDKISDMLRMFDTMLHLAELETGRLRSTFQPIELGPIIESVVDAYRPQFEESNISLVSEINTHTPINGDASLIARALSNLLENAHRHARSSQEVRVSLVETKGDIHLSVSDQGQGVDPADIQRIVTPFERVDRSRATPGHGLGLSIVSAIAALHHASLQIENASPGLVVALRFARQ
ncbi:MAG TPA: ATP-binding protein [Verrucomicrobiae bacterium]|nr:ATP-binding protein [Verrucomicrobiae bacterium]